MLRPVLALSVSLAVVAIVAGCAPKNVPRLAFPARVTAVCGEKQARLTALMSVMTSTDDIVDPTDRQTDRSVQTLVHNGGGAIGYWHDQPLFLPKTAHALGESGDYALVRAVAVTTPAEGISKHRIYLNVRDHGVQRWIAMDAYDTQNPCVEGHRSM